MTRDQLIKDYAAIIDKQKLVIDTLDKLTEKAKGLRKWCADKNACDAFDEVLAEIEKPKTE